MRSDAERERVIQCLEAAIERRASEVSNCLSEENLFHFQQTYWWLCSLTHIFANLF